MLARAKAAGLTTKSGLILGLGEAEGEVDATLADLGGVGVDIVTIGQYLRPTSNHLPVVRWWTPAEFDRFKAVGEALGTLAVLVAVIRTKCSGTPNSSATIWATLVKSPCPISVPP